VFFDHFRLATVLLLWRLSPLALVSASCQSVSPWSAPGVCQSPGLSAAAGCQSPGLPRVSVSPLVCPGCLPAPSGLSAAIGCLSRGGCRLRGDQPRGVEMALVPPAASAGRLERRPGPPLCRCRLVGRCVASSSLSVSTAAGGGRAALSPSVLLRAAGEQLSLRQYCCWRRERRRSGRAPPRTRRCSGRR